MSDDLTSMPADREQERAVESWLHGPVAAAYDAVEDGSAELMTLEKVHASLGREDRRPDQGCVYLSTCRN